jgi:hypothetical protein
VFRRYYEGIIWVVICQPVEMGDLMVTWHAVEMGDLTVECYEDGGALPL